MDTEKLRLLRAALGACNPVLQVDELDELVKLFESMGVEIVRVA